MAPNSKQSTMSLILIPAIITLAILILRTVGELKGWSPLFFNRQAGGGLAVVGISWLPIVFGIYFAVKLVHSGDQTAKPGKAILLSILAIVVTIVGSIATGLIAGKEAKLAPIIATLVLMTIFGLLLALGWRGLFNTLLAYGIAARIPVLIVMFFAIKGHWGTHYDALPPGSEEMAKLPIMSQYFDLAILPQIFLWIPFTIIVGSLFGGIAGLIAKRKG